MPQPLFIRTPPHNGINARLELLFDEPLFVHVPIPQVPVLDSAFNTMQRHIKALNTQTSTAHAEKHTCTPLHCYHPCSGKRVSKLLSCATPFLAVFLHRHTSEIGSMARPVQGIWVPTTEEKARNVIHSHSDTSQADHAYILHVDIANHLSATPSRDIHFTHAL